MWSVLGQLSNSLVKAVHHLQLQGGVFRKFYQMLGGFFITFCDLGEAKSTDKNRATIKFCPPHMRPVGD